MRHLLVPTSLVVSLLTAGSAFAAFKTGKGPCKTSSNCKSGLCVEVNGDSFCSQTCGSCPAGMYCDAQLFSAMGMKVCVKGREEAPVQPKAPARMPCAKDAECSGALICAQMMGHKDCTLPCKRNAACEMPAVMGVKFDFMACQVDEGDRSRKACLPKKACLGNPAGCMTLSATGMAGMGRLVAETQAWGQGAMPTEEPEEAMPTEHPPVAAPPPVPAPTHEVEAVASAMSPRRFSKFLAQLKKTSFDDERTALIRTTAKRNHFNCAQLSQVIDALSFADERMGATRIIAPKLVDPENSFEVLEHYDFGDERTEASQIFDSL